MNSEFALALHLILVMTHFPDRLFTSERLSELLNVHSVRIRKVLSVLKQNGLVQSKEGAGGGFSVCFDMNRVTLKDIYILTQKDVLKPKCHEARESCKVGANIQSVLTRIFSQADKNLQNELDGYSIQSVMDMMER